MKVPVFPDPVLTQYLTDLAKEQEDTGRNYLTKDSANHSVLLQSPGNSIYEVLVNDLGVVNTNLVLFSAPPPVIPGPPVAQLAVTESPDRAAFSGITPNAAGIDWNYLSGLTLSTAGSSATFSVALGVAADKTNIDLMRLMASINKTTAAWAVGSGNGALDTGSIVAATWYHVHLIKRPDTGVVDVLFSTSLTAPTLPTNYTLFRRIGSMFSNSSSQWGKFTQVGDTFLWDTPIQDVNGSGLNGSFLLFPLSVPPGLNVTAILRYYCSTTSGTMGMGIVSPLTSTTSGGVGLYLAICLSTFAGAGDTQVVTDTSRQVRVFTNASGGTQATYLITHGWIDTRGKLG